MGDYDDVDKISPFGRLPKDARRAYEESISDPMDPSATGVPMGSDGPQTSAHANFEPRGGGAGLLSKTYGAITQALPNFFGYSNTFGDQSGARAATSLGDAAHNTASAVANFLPGIARDLSTGAHGGMPGRDYESVGHNADEIYAQDAADAGNAQRKAALGIASVMPAGRLLEKAAERGGLGERAGAATAAARDIPTSAAVKFDDQVFTGRYHGDALWNAGEALGHDTIAKTWNPTTGYPEGVEGFTTKSGRFIGRDEAGQLLNQQGGAHYPDSALHASTLMDAKANRPDLFSSNSKEAAPLAALGNSDRITNLFPKFLLDASKPWYNAPYASLIDPSLDLSRDARMARAQEAGFDTSKTWYHGTTAPEFSSFDPARGGQNFHGRAGADPFMYFADNPERAHSMAEAAAALTKSNDPVRVMEAHLRNPTIDSSGDAFTRDPTAIRSPQAAFDPKLSSSANLLYSNSKEAALLAGKEQDAPSDEPSKTSPYGRLPPVGLDVLRNNTPTLDPNRNQYALPPQADTSQGEIRSNTAGGSRAPEGNDFENKVAEGVYQGSPLGLPGMALDIGGMGREAYDKYQWQNPGQATAETLKEVAPFAAMALLPGHMPKGARGVHSYSDEPLPRLGENGQGVLPLKGIEAEPTSSSNAPFARPDVIRPERVNMDRNTGLYSVADETLANLPRKTGNAQAWINDLRKGGTKPAELQYRGVDKFFADRQSLSDNLDKAMEDEKAKARDEGRAPDLADLKQRKQAAGNITKQELQDHLDANRVKIGEHIHNNEGESPDSLRNREHENINENSSDVLHDPKNYGYSVKDAGGNSYELHHERDGLISDGHDSEGDALSAAVNHFADAEHRRIDEMSPSELYYDTGSQPREQTSRYLGGSIPEGGKDYREHVYSVDGNALKRGGSQGYTAGYNTSDVHPDSLYNEGPDGSAIGWRLEQNYNNQADPGGRGILVSHENQSRWGQAGEGSDWAGNATPEQLADLKLKAGTAASEAGAHSNKYVDSSFDNSRRRVLDSAPPLVDGKSFSNAYMHHDNKMKNASVDTERAERNVNKAEERSAAYEQQAASHQGDDARMALANKKGNDALLSQYRTKLAESTDEMDRLQAYHDEKFAPHLGSPLTTVHAENPELMKKKLEEYNGWLAKPDEYSAKDLKSIQAGKAYAEEAIAAHQDPNGEAAMHHAHRQQQDQIGLRRDEARAAYQNAIKGVSPGPFVTDGQAMPFLMKTGLYNAAKNNQDFAISGPKRIADRWDEGAGSLYANSAKRLQKLAQSHVPGTKIEQMYPGDTPAPKGTYRYQDSIYNRSETPEEQSQGQLFGPNQGVDEGPSPSSAPYAVSKEPIKGVYMSPSAVGPHVVGSHRQVTKEALEKSQPRYHLARSADDRYPDPASGHSPLNRRSGGTALFRTREEAEKAMQQINESLEREKAKGVDPDAIVEQWKEDGQEPFNGIKMTPELRASILRKGFPMFLKAGAAAGLASNAAPFGRTQERDKQ